ncbi:MAG: hypothetical protein AAF414_24355 [Pseudomonadota bacterium]
MSTAVLTIIQVYGALGALVAIAFLFWGIDRVAEDARGSYAFRPLLVPGIVLIWPLVIWRWQALERGQDIGGRRNRPPRRTQDWLAIALAVVIPVILIVALLARQQGPFEWPAEQIEAPGAGDTEPSETAQ